MSRRNVLFMFMSFVAGIVAAVLAPRLFEAAADRFLFPGHTTELVRVPSPDGTVDAVMERIDCGPPCSSTYEVSIVPRGAASKDPAKQVFIADDVINGQVRWKEPHLLDIAYDKALIHSFRNVAYPFGRPGNVESWRYEVEARLSPSSARFSYLPDPSEPGAKQ